MRINSQTQLNMVIGYPLTHSQSPLLHNTIYQTLGMNALLLAFPSEHIEPLVHAIKALSVNLTAVTMPFKQAIIPYLDVESPEVSALKAANTVIQRDGKLYGYNTDIDGISFALRHVTLKNKNVLIIGAGGAARAAGYVMKKHNANLYWLNRTEEKAMIMAKEWGGEVTHREALSKLSIDIIINTTPIGMIPKSDESSLPHYIFSKEQTVFDMVYNPMNTELLKQAKSCHANIISGIDMFIGQGLRQIECWTNKQIVTDDLLTLIKNTLTSHSMTAEMR